MEVFNRRLVRQRRDRAAAGFDDASFLFDEVASRLIDRLDDTTRRFPAALDLGCRTGRLAAALLQGTTGNLGGRGGVEYLVQMELSSDMATLAARTGWPTVTADEEALPFADASFDLVLSNLGLHWVNDLPGALVQIRRTLKPDGLFLATLFGTETLAELRTSLAEAEIANDGGLSPRVSPFVDVRDAGALMQRAGFALPVVDAETITVSYAEPFKLLTDLRAMAETNAVLERRKVPLKRTTLVDALARYATTFTDEDGRHPATFQIITLTGWAPDASQPQAMQPGSAQDRLADALGTEEVSLGEKADPKG